MTVLNGTCFRFLCVPPRKPHGVEKEKRREEISVNVNTARQIKTVVFVFSKSQVTQRCRAISVFRGYRRSII